MKKLVRLFLLFIICAFLFTNRSAVAQSPSPSPEEEVSSEIKEKIKERLEESVGESIDKIKGLVEDEVNRLQKRAFAGSLKNVTTDTLLIEITEDIKQASFSAETTFVRLPSRKEIKAEDLTVGDFIIAMGFLNNNGVLETKRVVVTLEPTPAVQRKLFWGKIKEIDGEDIVFDDQEITVSSEKILKVKGIEEPSVNDINLGDKIFVLATVDKDGKIDELKIILVIPVKNGLEMQTSEVETEETTEEAEENSENEPSSSETED